MCSLTLASLDEPLWLWVPPLMQRSRFHPVRTHNSPSAQQVHVWVHVQFEDTSTQKHTHTLCSGMMSFSDSLSPVTGSIMSFLINFSTHSWVTTEPLDIGQRACQRTKRTLHMWMSEWRETCWHSRGSQDCAGNAVAQDVSGYCTYIPVLETEDRITPRWQSWGWFQWFWIIIK